MFSRQRVNILLTIDSPDGINSEMVIAASCALVKSTSAWYPSHIIVPANVYMPLTIHVTNRALFAYQNKHIPTPQINLPSKIE